MARLPPAGTPGSADDVESRFYEALRHRDIEGLMALWSDDQDIFCVQSSGSRIVGAAAIRQTFAVLLAEGAVDVRPERVRRVHAHDCAVHSVLEHLQVDRETGRQSVWRVATNVYVATARGWRIVSHHVSPGSTTEALEVADSAALLH